MRALLAFLDRRSKAFNVGLALLLVALVGIGDTVLPKQVSFSYLYLAPIAICAWYAARRVALGMAVICIAVWASSDFYSSGGIYPNPVLPLWNGTIRFSFYAILALLLAELRRSLHHEKELARTDFLTGLANPRWFYEVCDAEASRSRRYRRPMTLVYIDVDDFKSVNDRFGHRGGDDLLRVVGQTVRTTVRHTDFAARWGGDEFVILLPETDSDQAVIVVDKLRAQLLARVLAHGWPVTFSIGVGTLRRPEGTVEDFVARADSLMYLAKGQGKNTVTYQVWSTPNERTA